MERSLIWLDRTEIVNQTFDTAGKAQISIVTPADLAREGGRFSVSLTRVWDRHECMIALPDHNLSFEVRTTRVSDFIVCEPTWIPTRSPCCT